MSSKLWEVRYLLTAVDGALDAAEPPRWWPFVGARTRAARHAAQEDLHEAARLLHELDHDWLDALVARANWYQELKAADRDALRDVLAQVVSATEALGEDDPPPAEFSESRSGKTRYRRGSQSSKPMMAG